MSVSSTVAKSGPYAGDGATVTFPYAVQVLATSDIAVYLSTTTAGVQTDVLKTVTTDYTILMNADQTASPGGTVTFLVAPPVSSQVTLLRNTTGLQGVVLTNNGGFYPKVIENALDKLTFLLQQLGEQVARCIKGNVTQGATTVGDLAAAAAAASTAGAAAAAASATAAAGSATAAAGSATTAAGSVTAAAAQVTLAAGQVTLATNQVTLAAAQVTLATTQAGNAATSATAANASAVAAAASAATVSIPALAGNAGKSLVVNPGETAMIWSPGIPTGAEAMWPTDTPPTGWLEEDGSSLLRAGTYAALFAVIGTLYGAADGTHFNLPNAKGRFPRAWAHGSANDPDRASRTIPAAAGATMTAGDHVGTEQPYGVEAHVHSAFTSVILNGTANSNINAGAGNTGSYGGNETRPINTNRMMIIKF